MEGVSTGRPHFVEREKLLDNYSCDICSDVLVDPHQVTCGSKVCKACIDAKFGDETVIPCPLSHGHLGEEQLQEELCQQEGLKREHVIPDPDSLGVLLKEKCFCANRGYGCSETPLWEKLKEHLGECEQAELKCSVCKEKFDKHSTLMIHQKIDARCLTKAGKCHYHEYCGFESDSLSELKAHMRDEEQTHLFSLSVKLLDIEAQDARSAQKNLADRQKTINAGVKPLEKITGELLLRATRVEAKITASETSAAQLVNAKNYVTRAAGLVKKRVAHIEMQIRKPRLDAVVAQLHSHSRNLTRQNMTMAQIDERLRDLELASEDGMLIWRIGEYSKKKRDAMRSHQAFLYSHPFYTSKYGYKMCCKVYLNGDGIGRGRCLSIFFIVMRGEYDGLLTFPFKQIVTFSLLCQTNPSLRKHKRFQPDPESSSFRRPQTEMNIASGCPEFALQSEVESSTFLVGDCIYIRVRVAPGANGIQEGQKLSI